MKTSFHHLLLFIFLLFFLSPAVGQSESQTFVVYFDSDQSTIKPEGAHELDRFLELFAKVDNVTVTITAHTDSDGSEAYNDQLSIRRLKTVTTYLGSRLGKDEIISYVLREANGEKQPVRDNGTAAGKALNRRVEIRCLYITKPLEPEHEATVQSIQDLYKQLLPDPDVFCIDNSKDTTLTCPKGTIVSIPANAFGRQPGTSCTRITLREALDYSDMLLQNLSTDGDEGLLTTGGMIEIRAFDEEDRELQLAAGKLLTIFFPTDSILEGAKTYYGNRDNTHQQTMHWNGSNSDQTDGGGAAGIPLSYWIGGCWQSDCGVRCRLFCRIGRFPEGWRGLFDKEQRELNQEFRECQRSLRKARSEGGRQAGCVAVENRLLQSGIVPDSALFMRLYARYMEERGLNTMTEAIESLKKDAEEREKLEKLSYNMVQSNKMGYINCDFFSGKGMTNLIQISTGIPYAPNTDCKLVFPQFKAIMPATFNGKDYLFNGVPEGKTAWLVALKIEEDQPYLFLEKVKLSGKLPKIEFKKMSLEAITETLKTLDKL